MSLSWGAYVALSVAILIFLVHDELETFSATSDTMQLVPTRSQLRAGVTRCGRCGLMLFPMTPPGTRTPPKDPRSVILPPCTIHARTVGQETVLINVLARQLFVPAFKEGQTHLEGPASTHLYHCGSLSETAGTYSVSLQHDRQLLPNTAGRPVCADGGSSGAAARSTA